MTEMQSAHRMMVDTLKGMIQLASGLQENDDRRIREQGFAIQENAKYTANTFLGAIAKLGATPDEHKEIRAEFDEIVNPQEEEEAE